MGEIADMMLDGTLDAVTGEYLGPPCGYPRSKDKDWNRQQEKNIEPKKIKCEICGKYFIGIDDHIKAKHLNPVYFTLYCKGEYPQKEKYFLECRFTTRSKARKWCSKNRNLFEGLTIVHPNGEEEKYESVIKSV